MKPRALEQYIPTEEMIKNELGIGAITIYQLNNSMSYFIMGEYHGKGALMPTVGSKYSPTNSIYDTIASAFQRIGFIIGNSSAP
jgi:hypothetical protein